MLAEINLDDENFEELVEEAKHIVASYYAGWTDFNYHDPGITLIELFAFLKEIAQYRMNYIGEEHLKKYLKLMGIERRQKTPARARVSVNCKKSIQLPAMTRFYASGVCFESTASKYLAAGDVRGCIYPGPSGPVFVEQAHMGFKIPAFGKEPEGSQCLYILFDEPLPVNTPLSLFVAVYNDYGVKRSPVGGWSGFLPLAGVNLEYLTSDGWAACKDFKDQTYGLLESGWIAFSLELPMERSSALEAIRPGAPGSLHEGGSLRGAPSGTQEGAVLSGAPAHIHEGGSLQGAPDTGGYFLRLRLMEAHYDVPPVVTEIKMNCLDVVQTRHYAACTDLECICGDGLSLCRLEANEVTTGNLSVLVPDSAGAAGGGRLGADTSVEGAAGGGLRAEACASGNVTGDAASGNSAKDGTPAVWRIYENYTLHKEGSWLVLTFKPDEEGRLPKLVRVLAWELLFDMSQSPGVGDGLPFQEYSLEGMNPEAASFRLMIEQPEDPCSFVEWQQVPDFSGSGPQDCHYILDTRLKKLVFGDCIRGMAPQGRLFICQYASCEGSRGNVKARTINRLEEGYEELSVINEDSAFGGCDLEVLEDCFMRARRALHENGALVTDKDYEDGIRKTPGLMIENCRVIYPNTPALRQMTEKHRMTIVVKPFSFEKHPRLTPQYSKNIALWLEERRMVGTDIQLVSPEYLRLNVFVECKGRNNYIFDRAAIVKALDRYFAPFASDFGKVISQSEVYEILDRLEAVELMEALSMDVAGNHVERSLSGDIILPPNGLLSPEDIHYNININ